MPLAVGSLIGAYEVVGSLGAGGMGEVYRARDTRLNRDVALIIVPEAFALDADRLARFQREAQVLASLNHPNIAAIYGFEDERLNHPAEAGLHVRALVLELVEGETLADRIARGPIPIDEALPIARQIAEALESAHEQGVIHRDLKPANIKVRDDGTVKVLDFGLAKMLENEATASSSSLSLSPTITTPAMTQIGMILGTAAYMAPEQARGKAADRRSDVWAFGCVLFEMLTGVQAFAGEDVTDVIAAVVRGEPAWNALPADTPPSIELLLRRCLEKDRRKRVGDISGALFVLREPVLTSAKPLATAAASPAPPRRSGRLAAAIVGALVVGAAIAAGTMWQLMKPLPPDVVRLAMSTTEAQIARNANGTHVAIAPDGSSVAYVAATGTVPTIHIRRRDNFDAIAVAQPATYPFFRPDGKEIGFVNQGMLRRVAVTGGPSVEVARVEGQLAGATWGSDGRIVFASSSPKTGLMRVPAGGGNVEVLTQPAAGTDHVMPRFLPGIEAVLFTIRRTAGDAGTAEIAVLDLRSSPPQTNILVRGGSDARYVSSGHLVYLAGNSLRAIPFDLDALKTTADTATPVLAGMATLVGQLGADFDVSATGTLAYLTPRSGSTSGRTMAWVDRRGREQSIDAPARPYLYPQISPDGTRVALDVRDAETDIWVWDLQRKGFTRVTRDPNLDRTPVWANDNEILFSSMTEGTPTIYRQRADGTGTPERLADAIAGEPLFPSSLAGNRLLVNSTVGGPQSGDLVTIDVSRSAGSTATPLPKPQALVMGPAGEINGTVSPDGRWLAYQSNESGMWEVYVQPYGAGTTGLRATVSNTGGVQPRWSLNSPELFYVSGRNEMMVVKVRPGTTWMTSVPERLFDAGKYFFGVDAGAGGNPFFNYDVARDGRFLMLKSSTAEQATAPTPDYIMIVQHWTEELKRISGR